MYSSESYFQTITNPNEILRGLLKVSNEIKFDSFIAAVAYATTAGSKLLNEKLQENIYNWDSITKRWLISIDYGNTEPQALTYLKKMPNSEVRIPNAIPILANQLRPEISFHPKVYLFFEKGTEALGIFSGSANLSLSGLQLNTEYAVSQCWSPPLDSDEKPSRDEIQTTIDAVECSYTDSEMLTSQLIQKYQEYYQKLKRVREDTSEIAKGLSEPKRIVNAEFAALLATITNFWIDIEYVVENRGPGKPGNQIDMPRGSRIFFGFGVGEVPRNTSLGDVIIEYNDIETECRLRFGNNQMDKMTLPIPNSTGPPTYVNQTLLFTRLSNNKFELSLGTSSQISKWKSTSRNQGSFFSMQSGREFGAFN